MKIRTTIFAAVCAATALAAGCGDSGPTPSATPAPAANTPKPVAAATAGTTDSGNKEIVTTVAYSYNPVSKRDPFRAPDEVRAPKIGGTDTGTPCNDPLCAWDLDQLTLVAVVTGDANPIAMLEDPQGKGYIVRRNSRVGRLGGKVSNILRDQIMVTEYWTQPNGESKPIQKPVKIKEDKSSTADLDLLTGKMVEASGAVQ